MLSELLDRVTRMPKKFALLAIIAAVGVWAAWHIVSGWGLVTIHARNQPLSKVLSEISRQGGIEIVSNLDPTTTVDLEVRRVPGVEALDIVSVRTDAAWQLAYLGASDKAAIDSALSAFVSGSNDDSWTAHSSGGTFFSIEPESGAALDLRRLLWNPAPGPLHEVLAAAAQRTGVLFAAPTDWNPSVSKQSQGELRRIVPQFFSNAGGTSREVFLLRASPRSNSGAGSDETGRPETWAGRGTPWIGAPSSNRERGPRGARPPLDPLAVAERVEAQIALLPKSEQVRAREDLTTMRTQWDEIRALPEDQRRERMREMFSSPQVAERMEVRSLARDAKRTPEQRLARSIRYFERKAAAQNANATPQ